jgi:LacI family transcriptional regulator
MGIVNAAETFRRRDGFRLAATYKDIRRLTGLSLATISKHFNGGNVLYANRVLIEQAARDLGYQVNDFARGLRSRRSMTLGVVLAELNSTFYTTIVSAMEERLRDAGYGTIICDSRGSAEAESEALRFLIGKMVDGIVIVPVGDEVDGLDAAAERGLPVVAIDRVIANAAVDAVVIDNRAAIASAVELLVEAGHTELALLAGPDTTYTMRERRIGFREAVRRHTGRLPARALTQPDPVSIEGGNDGFRRLMQLGTPPTAVVCANYEFTLGASIALNDLGGELPAPALVGFDNLDLARIIRPRPTLVAQPVAQIATRAADLILERIRGEAPDAPRTVVLETALVVGDPATYTLARSRP